MEYKKHNGFFFKKDGVNKERNLKSKPDPRCELESPCYGGHTEDSGKMAEGHCGKEGENHLDHIPLSDSIFCFIVHAHRSETGKAHPHLPEEF